MIGKLLKIAAWLVVAGMVLLGAFIGSIWLGAFGRLPTQAELIHYKNKTASLVRSMDGELIGKYFDQNRTNIAYDQLPDQLVEALLATEDVRFFEHQGIDSRSLMRVIFKSILFRDPDAGGGSTISQQLVKNMYGRGRYGFLSLPVNKIREALIARRLEKTYSKEDILALYLNTVAFGENLFGIEAAAGRYFNKSAANLRLEESAVLVGILKANTTYNPHLNPENSRTRRNVVLMQMAKYQYITPAEADSLSALPLKLDYANIEANGQAAYFLVRVKAETQEILAEILRNTGKEWKPGEDGLVINTTLDLKLQRFALRAFREHLSVMQGRLRDQYRSQAGLNQLHAISDTLNIDDVILHAGLLALDPGSGEIRAWVGGIDFQNYPYDQVLARRQLASAFKPIIYATGLENGISPCYYLDNETIAIEGFEDWSPRNYDLSTGGKYSMAGALAHSMNVPTVNLYLELGFDKVEAMWHRLGFSFQLTNVPSVALGTPEGTIEELAIAYSAFANGGLQVKPGMITSITTADGKLLYQKEFHRADERILSEETSVLMNAMLQKAVREGTGATLASVYGVSSQWAGKTGTSQNYSDAWFGVYNPGLVLVTRVGAATPAIHFNQGSNGSGSTLALPLAAITLRRMELDPALRKRYIHGFPPLPEALAGALDCPDYRDENFLEKVESFFSRDKKVNAPDKKLAEPGTQPRKDEKKKRSIFDIFKRRR